MLKQFSHTYLGMMDMGGRIVYILYVLFSVLSRILCLELFAISLGPGKFSWIYLVLTIHLVLIFLINIGFQKWLKNDKVSSMTVRMYSEFPNNSLTFLIIFWGFFPTYMWIVCFYLDFVQSTAISVVEFLPQV